MIPAPGTVHQMPATKGLAEARRPWRSGIHAMITCRLVLSGLVSCLPLACCLDGGGGWGNNCAAKIDLTPTGVADASETLSSDSSTLGPTTSMDTTMTATETSTMSATTMMSENCGNGKVEAGEDCDDGDDDNSDACVEGCQAASCGDGFVQVSVEECDDGQDGDNSDECLDTCKKARCGDGAAWAGNEDCDDGNGVQNDTCTNSCKFPACGDGFVQTNEVCDKGAGNVDPNVAKPTECTTDCIITCGDGVLTTQEPCDDGNAVPGDGCSPECEDEFVMFVSSGVFNGNLGGTTGADAECKMLAESVSLTGTYVAWLSESDMNKASTDLPMSEPMIRRDGKVIVDKAEHLIAGDRLALKNPISLTEESETVSGYAWTGTGTTGGGQLSDCSNWSTDQGIAQIGNVNSLTSEWTFSEILEPTDQNQCSKSNRIYCFRKKKM